MIFDDRAEAGRVLAGHLSHFASKKDLIILALPRGGVPVGYEIALALRAPLDVLVARKLGMPKNPECAIGAIAPGGVSVISEKAVESSGLSAADVDALVARETRELARREVAYRAGRRPLELADRTAIIVDDGFATGATMLAAILSARQRRPDRVVAAAPVGDPQVCESLRRKADEVVCAAMPSTLFAVGEWYRDFTQMTDDQVISLLTQANSSVARR